MSYKRPLGSMIISLMFVLIANVMDNRTSLYFLVVALTASGFRLASASCEQATLGLADGYILDSQLTASSELNANTPAKNGRLNYTAGSSWCASTSDSNPYLQIDLQTLHIICAVSTQGNSQAEQWVKTYILQSSTDGTTWTGYKKDGPVKGFSGNYNQNSAVKHILYSGIIARYLRFAVGAKYGEACLRVEVYGVSRSKGNIALFKPTEQSSTFVISNKPARSSYAVDGGKETRFRYCTHTGDSTNTNPWWRVDLGREEPVAEVRILNRGDCCGDDLDGANIRVGNSIANGGATNRLCVGNIQVPQGKEKVFFCRPKTLGRYVSISLSGIKRYVMLCEVEVYPTYISNVALNQPTSHVSTVHGGVASRAVDGVTTTAYSRGSCTHTNYSTDPWWRVDLGTSLAVAEVVIVNRACAGECATFLSAFEIRIGNSNQTGGQGNPSCGGIHSMNSGETKPFYCDPPLVGQFVFIRIPGNRKLLSICEVEVYSTRRGGNNVKACAVEPIGISSSSAIPDQRFSASSSRSGSNPSNGRLKGGSAWIPGNNRNSSDYLKIDLGSVYFVCGVATQGNPNADDWTKTYKIATSLDNANWKDYVEDNIEKNFTGNNDRTSIVRSELYQPLAAKFIRFYPVSFNKNKALRVEVYGSMQGCLSSMASEGGLTRKFGMTASSELDERHKAGYSRLYGITSWCSQLLPAPQYLEADFRKVMTVTGTATQGDNVEDKWVTSYEISYGYDGKTWFGYAAGQELVGNSDKATIIVNWFSLPFAAQYVRIIPKTYNNGMCMRVDLFACKEFLPEFTTRPQSQLITEGENVTLLCNTAGAPASLVFWTKRGAIIIASGDPRISFGADNKTLTITNVSRANSGQYRCVANVSAGEVISSAATLDVQFQPEITAHPVSTAITEGDDLLLTCNATGNPTPSTSWTKGGSLVNVSGDPRISSTTQNTKFSITNVRRADDGQYRCVASNSIGNVTSNAATLDVQYQPDFIAYPQNVTKTEGDNVTLSCDATGNPAPTFSLKKDGSSVNISTNPRISLSPDKKQLTITNVNRADGGQYRCVAINSVQTVFSNVAVLNVHYQPDFFAYPQNTTKTEGDNVTLSCDATGNPAPTFLWKKDGSSVNISTNPRISLSPDKKQLTIMNVSRADGGQYRCVAINSVQTVFSNVAVLDVHLVPDPPMNLIVELKGSRVVVVSWTAGFDGNSNILNYTAEISEDNQNFTDAKCQGLSSSACVVTSSLTSASLEDLLPWTTYYIRVFATNKIGPSATSAAVNTTTDEEEPNAPPSGIQGHNTSSTSILVQWGEVPPADQNGVILSYTVTYKALPDGSLQTKVVSAPTTEVTLTDLNEYTNYSITVFASTLKGGGLVSEPTFVVTAQDRPSASPANFRAYVRNATSIFVEWGNVPAADQNGVILSYTVTYMALPNGSPQTMLLSTLTNEVILTGLNENTNYSITVFASTAMGDGNMSLPVFVITGYNYREIIEEVSITEGETRTLNCTKEFYDGISREWSREDGTPVFNNRRVLTEDGQIQIINASFVDAGVYICVNAPQIRHKFIVSIQAFIKVEMVVRVLNYEYSPELKNKTSPVYKSLEQNFTTEMDKVYNNTPGYVRTEVLNFAKGSVKVDFRVIIVIVATDPKNATTIPDKKAQAAHRVVVEAKDGFVKQLQVDPNVEVKTPPLEPRGVEIFDKESDELSVRWRPPEDSDAFKVEEYVLQHREFKATVYTNASFPATKDKDTYSFRIQNLEPETTYMIRVGAKNKYGSNFNEEEGHETLDAPFAKWIIAVIVLAIVLVLGIIVGVVICMRKRAEERRRQLEEEEGGRFGGLVGDVRMNSVSHYEERKVKGIKFSYTNDAFKPTEVKWKEIPYEDINLLNELGSGAFGVVYKGELTRDKCDATPCAVKALKASATNEEIRDLYNELEIMTNVGYHPNLVNLLGACTEDGHLLVVLEIAENGSLLEFLKKSREPNQNYGNIVSGGLTEAMKLRIAIDVARGMAHLASCRCIHRDLAARNVLLGENYVAKVSDYGMARDVYEQLMYKKETQGKLPVKWMAIESLETYIFTVESDVWSYGVLLWEIESGGLKPYAGMNTTEIISELKRGYRLEKPNGCSDEMYQVMRDCWDANPKARPSFDQLVIRLENMAVSL